MMLNMKISREGVKFVEFNEGLKLKAYKDLAGVLTIGYGHTGPEINKDMEITQEKAEELLKKDLIKAIKAVNQSVKVSLTQNQFDSLVDFVFNVGEGAFKKSTLLKHLNEGEYGPAADEFLRWVYAGGKQIKGLGERRKREKEFFECDDCLQKENLKQIPFKWLTAIVEEVKQEEQKPVVKSGWFW